MIEVERVGFIGDVHTERARLQAALDYLRGLSLDRIVCTGDLPDGPGTAADVDACCALLADAEVLTVHGNHDRWLLDGEQRQLPGASDREELKPSTLSFLAALPATLSLRSPAGEVLLCHGLGKDDMAGVQPYDHGLALEQNEALQGVLQPGGLRYLINGHTHRAMLRSIGPLTIVNAGTLLRDHGIGLGVVDFAKGLARFCEVTPSLAVRERSEASL